mmetsp:Transcript_5414/g.13119  ORF Transcript_5414/g.13119 Transcript_5414/m.13119 type:complete len:980 (-) Transcript_5414:67-3006(-)
MGVVGNSREPHDAATSQGDTYETCKRPLGQNFLSQDVTSISPAATLPLLLMLALSYQWLLYFLALGLAMFGCYSADVGVTRKAVSVAVLAVTWFYIIRFMATYDGPHNAFDAAYADVVWGGLSGNWAYTQTLLAWAVVATVWSADASICYTLFGVLGTMAGSYVLFVPKADEKMPRKISAVYILTSLAALLSIVMLPLSDNYTALGWWLWLLHVSVVAPQVLAPLCSFQVDRALLYGALAVACFMLHASAGRSPFPDTDCRISINVDAAACACITLVYIHSRTGSSTLTCIAGMLTPLVSAGCVHAIFCAWEHGLWAHVIHTLQWSLANRMRCRRTNDVEKAKYWMNLGYWEGTQDYDVACAKLAKLLAAAVQLQDEDRLLCVACGNGEELRFFSEEAGCRPKQTVGLDAALAESPLLPVLQQMNVRLLQGHAEEMLATNSDVEGLVYPGEFNRIIVVDSIYHLKKSRFFHDCAKLLPEHGSMAVTDVILRPTAPLWLKMLLCPMGIPLENHWTEADYRAHLLEAGYSSINIASLEPHVLNVWFPSWMCRHLDYVLISATMKSTQPRPRAAVVGSGLSGLAAARLLSATHDVTVFEARGEPNLAGWEAKLSNGSVVDIPLRMIEHNYWCTLVAFCQRLGITLVPTNFTVSLYDPAGTSQINTAVDSQWRNILKNARWYSGLLLAACQLALRRPLESESLRDFAHRLGQDQSDFYKVGVLRHFSWILSCTYDMVEKYPVTLVHGFFRAIMGNFLKKQNPTVRVFPSVRRLQETLLMGNSIVTNYPVPPFKQASGDAARSRPSHIIDGTSFDAVVIATEAKQVTKILPRDWASCFDEFQYHPSHVFVHRDPSLMPGKREDWRAVNVCDDEEGGACQITVWVNAYYDGIDLGGDVFETVNPRHAPRLEFIIRECHLERVVHTSNSAKLQAQIEALQGKEGFYFCGAYCVPGLGLLEQALLSAETAVKAVRAQQATSGKKQAN